jgi:hypothetical protein
VEALVMPPRKKKEGKVIIEGWKAKREKSS